MRRLHAARNRLVAATAVLGLWSTVCVAQTQNSANESRSEYRGLLGSQSKKIRHEAGKTFLWAGPRGTKPDGAGAEWYDFTDSVIPAVELQFGIGKDTIPAIDDPLFVSPDDPRLLKMGRSPFRREEPPPKTTDDIRVIGYARGGEARAYPVRLLDHHELVNDDIGGKPVTVGW